MRNDAVGYRADTLVRPYQTNLAAKSNRPRAPAGFNRHPSVSPGLRVPGEPTPAPPHKTTALKLRHHRQDHRAALRAPVQRFADRLFRPLDHVAELNLALRPAFERAAQFGFGLSQCPVLKLRLESLADQIRPGDEVAVLAVDDDRD